MSGRRSALGVYVHLPFCAQRCGYCDFAILTQQSARAPEYLDALEAEIRRFVALRGARPVETLYFGGGTPSLLPAAAIERLAGAVAEAFGDREREETSIEANPEDLSPKRVERWRAAGIDRVTIGIQTIDDAGLAVLARPGGRDVARAAFDTARRSGLRSVGVDLIFGWPGQTAGGWREELTQVVDWGPDHLSLYALETTSRTPLVRAVERGELPATDPDLAAEMYGTSRRLLDDAGYEHYEISNFARPGHRSAHNLRYWRDEDYVGFGLSAASYVDGERWTAPRGYQRYRRYAGGDEAAAEHEPYDADRRCGEALVFGLRCLEGVCVEQIAARHGREPLERREPILTRGVGSRLIVRESGRLRLTDRGLLLADELFRDLL